LNRRDFLRVGALSAAGLTLADWLKLKAHGQAQQRKAKSVIQFFMLGGPTHLDTWDPKPEAGDDYCGPLKNPVQTNVPGIRSSELLPLSAKQADKFSSQNFRVQGFGQSCLLARRLVEQAVPFITINWGWWDTHTDNFGAVKANLPVFDQGFASLMEDLAQRGCWKAPSSSGTASSAGHPRSPGLLRCVWSDRSRARCPPTPCRWR
jgi:hypothetical protein